MNTKIFRARPYLSRTERGSVLLVSLIFSAVIAISVGSYLRVALQTASLSYRTYYLGVAMNVAETGLERALWSINRANAGGTNAWTGWSAMQGSTGAHCRTFDLGTVEGGANAQVKVYVRENAGSGNPMIIARAIVTPPRGAPVEKWIQVTLNRRGRVAVGGLGREGIRATGNNVYFASWNSDPDNNPATPFVPYSEAVRRDRMSLATTTIDATLNSGNADVNGTVAVGSSSIGAVQIGPQGYIGPFGTPEGTIAPGSVSTDFTADLDVVPAPTGKTYINLGAVTNDLTLPRPGDTPNTDGVYYYEATQINLNNKTLTIAPGNEVVIHIPTSLNAISVGGGSGAIQVNGTKNPVTGVLTTSTLKIYTPGNISIGGQGTGNELSWVETSETTQTVTTRVRVGNKWVDVSETVIVPVSQTITIPGQPRSLQIYGTRTNEQAAVSGMQDFTISGNGSLSAVVYAPNADISANGGGNAGFIYGSLIGGRLTFTGNDAFYYDESLVNLENDFRFGIDSWNELVSYVDRETYRALMNF